MTGNYKVIERYPHYAMPVGSVIQTDAGQRIFYRNIDGTKVFSKGGFKAICIDEAVVNYLQEKEKIDEVVFDFEGVKTYKVSFEQYIQTPTITMAGRKQKRLNMDRFIVEDKPTIYKRPAEAVEININGN